MMANVAALRKPKAAPDPLRQALHAAIAGEREAAAAVEELKRGVRTAHENVKAAQAKLEKAQEMVADAIAEHGGALAVAAKTGRPAPTNDVVARARAEVQSLEDAVAAGEGAIAQLQREATHARTSLAEAQRTVERARSEVLAESILPLLAEANDLRERLIPLVAALSGVRALHAPHGTGLGYLDPDDAVEKVFLDIRMLLGNLVHLGERGMDHEWGAKWRACRAALQADPDAVLPELK
jgi:chromosome segregation ATPase